MRWSNASKQFPNHKSKAFRTVEGVGIGAFLARPYAYDGAAKFDVILDQGRYRPRFRRSVREKAHGCFLNATYIHHSRDAMSEEKNVLKKCVSAQITVNGSVVSQSDCTIGRGYVNMSWAHHKYHFSVTRFDEKTAPHVTGESQITFRFQGVWDDGNTDTKVDWPIVIDFADKSEFSFAAECLLNLVQRQADPFMPKLVLLENT